MAKVMVARAARAAGAMVAGGGGGLMVDTDDRPCDSQPLLLPTGELDSFLTNKGM